MFVNNFLTKSIIPAISAIAAHTIVNTWITPTIFAAVLQRFLTATSFMFCSFIILSSNVNYLFLFWFSLCSCLLLNVVLF